MPESGKPLGIGARVRKTSRRKARSNQIPPEVLPETDPVISNLTSLVDVQFKPMFYEMYERGRGNITAFASDFLDVTLEKDGKRHDGMERWWHEHFWTPERMLSSGNRWGKTWASSVKLLHNSFYQVRDESYAELTNDYVALNLSLTIDMSKISWDYALARALDSKIFRRFVVEPEIKTAPFPVLPIGISKSNRGINAFRSEIWARSSAKDARYLLGKRFDLINYDECSRDPHGDKILDEVIRMRLADRNGRLDMTSTAAGKNWFYKQYMRGIDDRKNGNTRYYSQTGITYENPFIDLARVKSNEEVMAKMWAEQNIYGGFADFMNVFDRLAIEAMYDGVYYKLCDNYIYLPEAVVHQDHEYLMAVDWGIKRDETVILVADISVSPAPIVFAQNLGIKSNGSRYTWNEQKDIVAMVHRRYNNAPCLFDSTGMVGEILYSNLSDLGMTNHEGYDFAGGTGQAKDHLIFVAQQALQSKAFQLYYNQTTQNLIDQLLLYDRDDKLLPTDWVFAFALLAERLRRTSLPIAEILSLPFYFGFGSRRFGKESIDQYEIRHNAKREEPNNFIMTNVGRINA